jgi:hypothetical protein
MPVTQRTQGSRRDVGGRVVGIGVDIRGIPELQAALAKFEDAPAKKLLQKASTAGAKALKPPIQGEAPVGPSGNRHTKRGALRRSVSSRQARKDRPAAVVSARPKVAFYRHMVIGGTKPHDIRRPATTPTGGQYMRVIHHPGAKANPFVERGFQSGEAAALAAIDRVIDEALAKL